MNVHAVRTLAAAALLPEPRTPAAREARTRRRLRRLIDHAYATSPYYRALFDAAGIDPHTIRDAQSLRRIPITPRAAARERTAEIRSTAAPATAGERHTTGTGGLMLRVPCEPWENAVDVCLWARGYRAHGHAPWARQAKVCLSGRMPKRPRLPQRLGLFRRDYIPLTCTPREKVERLRALRPRSLVAWGSVYDELSMELERAGTTLDIPLIFSTSDTLAPDVRRRAVERMGSRIVDVYGSVETGPIAWECPRGNGYHIRSDWVIVETVDEAGRPADRGRVVCTVLWRRTFPLIRYELGDLAEWGSHACPCGSAFPSLRRLMGRESELIRLPDGACVTGATLREAILIRPDIRAYQLVQEEEAAFLVRLVTDTSFSAASLADMRAALHARFGNAVRFRFVTLPALPHDPETKFTALVSAARLRALRAQGADTSRYFTGTPLD